MRRSNLSLSGIEELFEQVLPCDEGSFEKEVDCRLWLAERAFRHDLDEIWMAGHLLLQFSQVSDGCEVSRLAARVRTIFGTALNAVGEIESRIDR